MNRIALSLPELAIIAGTRAAGGAGIALLLGDHLDRKQRRTLGWALLGVGVITTIPIALELFSARHCRGGGRTALEEEHYE